MVSHPPHAANHWLVPIAPELLVAVQPGKQPTIIEVAPQIAGWLGRSLGTLLGYSLADALDSTIPGLDGMVEQVMRSEMPMQDYRVTFTDARGASRTVRIHAMLKPQRSRQGEAIVGLRFEEVSSKEPPLEVDRESLSFHGMLGHAPSMLKVFRKIEMYGPTDAPVLVTGETGTGKELAARALHMLSRRHGRPYVAVNCSALSEELLESELFGHEKGSFTGAIRAHRGRFERANGGTLFLDELGEMPLRTQVKLLRVLEEKEIERVGGEEPIRVDVRLVAATNAPLELAVQTRTFRADLYHRLAVLRIHMPPLRERPEDLPLLVEHFLQFFNHTYQRHVQRVTPDGMALLSTYAWPGNIRELRNVLERVFVETTTDVIGRKAFDEWVEERAQFVPGTWNVDARQTSLAKRPVFVAPYAGLPYHALLPGLPAGVEGPPPIEVTPDSFTYLESGTASQRTPFAHLTSVSEPKPLTAQNVAAAYRRAAGNLSKAARFLGVHRATLYRHLKALGLSRGDLLSPPEALPSRVTGNDTHEVD